MTEIWEAVQVAVVAEIGIVGMPGIAEAGKLM
jgi:hypothetical protein